MRGTRLLSSLALSALPLAGCVGDPLVTGDRAAAIVGGTDSSRSLVSLGGTCGAAVVAPTVLLTAKHCVTPVFGGAYECSEAGEVVQLDDNVMFPEAGKYGAVRSVDDITIGRTASPYAPRVVEVLVTPGATICADDAALLVLDRPMDDPVVSPLRLAGSPAVGEPLVAIGHGGTLDAESSSALQERSVVVQAIGPAPEVPGVASPVPVGFFSTGEALCRGDSGSPALSTSGAVVGVASAVSRIDLDAPTGTSADCVSPLARSKYQSLASIEAFVLDGFEIAGETPWLDGEADPSAGLADFGASCAEDVDCRSNVCVDDGEVGRFCSHGCLETACPDELECVAVDDRMRCVPAPDDPDPPAPDESSGGCSVPPHHPAAGALLVLLAFAARSGRGGRWRHGKQPKRHST
jgi:hypothetical protein